jgi:Skp family chaperone for outer membrane proteins
MEIPSPSPEGSPDKNNARIALVDYNKILMDYSKAINSKKEMEELASNYQKERNEREADLRRSSGEALQVKQREMAAFAQTASKVLEDKRQRLTQELTADVNQALALVARNHSCDLVFVKPEIPSPGALIFAADFPEVSDQLLERLNNPNSSFVSSTRIPPKTPRIAVVDYNKVLKNYSKAVRSQKQMEELASDYQKERNEREADLRRSSGEALQLKQREMAAFGQTASKILEDKRQRLTQELTADINQALASLAKNSCDLVFVKPEIPSPGALIFAADFPDITDRVLEELDGTRR